jgi:hypothetical protein
MDLHYGSKRRCGAVKFEEIGVSSKDKEGVRMSQKFKC